MSAVCSGLTEHPSLSLAHMLHDIVLSVVEDIGCPWFMETWRRFLQKGVAVDAFVQEFNAVGLAASLEGPELEARTCFFHRVDGGGKNCHVGAFEDLEGAAVGCIHSFELGISLISGQEENSTEYASVASLRSGVLPLVTALIPL